MNSRLH